MELIDALRTTGAVREFSEEPVTDDVLWHVLDDARFAPSGGNRQAWHVVVVRDRLVRQRVRDLYLDAWHDYVSHVLAGVSPFSPLASGDDRAAALAQRPAALAASRPEDFAERMDRAPVMLVVCANLAALAATDRDLGRYQIVGGASIYPFVWNILLAAHERGLGGVLTTVATRNEDDLRDVLAIPPTFAVASVVVLGYPLARPTALSRRAVEHFSTVDAFDGRPFTVRGPVA
ncbi:MAG: nitroreductase family protein [Acidimicrobiales bacterium]|jgi:nitroreductase